MYYPLLDKKLINLGRSNKEIDLLIDTLHLQENVLDKNIRFKITCFKH